MKLIKLFSLAFLAIAAVACSPRRTPVDDDTQYATNSQTGNGNNAITEIASDELSAADERGNSSVDQKVGEWITSNSIPQEAILCTIYFNFDNFNVSASERSKLDAIAQQLTGKNIYIVGYSDYFGSEDYNLALSDKRANAVKTYLNNINVANSAQTKAMGEQFATKNGTKEEVREDRKVVIIDGNK